MSFFQLLFSFSLYLIFIRAGFIQDKLFDGIEMHFDRLDNSCGGKNTPFQLFLQGLKTTSTKVFVKNNTFIVKEGGFKKLSLIIVINRCRYKENLDTCEQFLKQDNIDLCKAINPDDPFVNKSPFYAPFVPPLKCPFNKGIYRASNVTFDIAPLLVFNNIESWYWKMKYEVVSEQKKLLFCNFLDVHITKSKTKRH